MMKEILIKFENNIISICHGIKYNHYATNLIITYMDRKGMIKDIIPLLKANVNISVKSLKLTVYNANYTTINNNDINPYNYYKAEL